MNVRENRRENQKWTIQGHGQHWVHKTQTKKHNRENEDEQHGLHKKNREKPITNNMLAFFHLIYIVFFQHNEFYLLVQSWLLSKFI